MRRVEGFVCIAQSEEIITREILFGQNQGMGQLHYEALATNGLVPFDNLEIAKIAQDELRLRKDFLEVALGKINLLIATGLEDFGLFKRKRRLAVIGHFEGSTQLIGSFVEGKPGIYPLPGAYLSENGFKTISNLEVALHIAHEIGRQGRSGANIASFFLRKI